MTVNYTFKNKIISKQYIYYKLVVDVFYYFYDEMIIPIGHRF